jgi:ABC-type Zn uptake system ZnuABC Zn-binding protein ZnuA
VPAVFAEHDATKELTRYLIRIARAAGVPVISALWGDTLGSPGSSDARYLDAFADNVTTIAASLGAPSGSCDLPD